MEEISSTVSQEGNVRTLDSVGRLFSNTWCVYKKRFWLLVGIIIAPLALSSAGSLMIKGGFPESTYGWVFLVVGFVLMVFAGIAMIFAVVKNTDFAGSYRSSVTIFWSMLWMNLLLVLAVMGGMVMAIVPGIILGTWLLFTGFILINEDTRGIDALLKSREYVKGYWWAIFGRCLLLIIFSLVISVIDLLISKIFGTIAGMAIYDLLILFFTPFSLSYIYSLYKNFTFIKPEVRNARPQNSKRFLIVSMIVGLVAPIIIFAGLFVASSYLSDTLSRVMSDGAVGGQGNEILLGASSTPFGEISVVLPVGFVLENVGPEQVIIQPANSTKPIGSSIITVAFSSLSPDAYVSAGESTYTSYGYTFTQSTTTFLGYPATEISLVLNKSSLTETVFEANNETFAVSVTKASASAGSPTQAINTAIDGIIASMQITNTPVADNPVEQQEGVTTTIPVITTQNNSNQTSAKPSISILSPSGGETWQMGQRQTIKWTSVGMKNVVVFIHFSDGGMCREGILPAASGEYSFVLTPTCPNMPATLTSGQYTINITDSDLGSNNPEAWSQPFNIVASNQPQPSIILISPNGGEVWQQGQTYQVTWQRTNFNDEVAINLIDYTPGARYGMQYGITNGMNIRTVPGQTNFAWTIPTSVPPGDHYKVAIGMLTVDTMSNNYFTIVAPSSN